MQVRLLLLAALVACSRHPSPLDHAFGQAAGSGASASLDPWDNAQLHAHGDDDDKGGFDIQGALAKIKDSIDKPGPYETPEQSAGFDASKPHVGVLRLHGGIVEREAFSWTGGHGTELRQLADRLRELAKDDTLTGLVLRVDSIEASLPDAIELRSAMKAFRAAHKTLRCHAEGASNNTYLVLAACDTIGLAPLGEIAITGPAAMPVHVKPLLDRLGIQADFLHVGAYKGAAEPLTRDAPSKEMEETLGAILDQRYQTMVDIIAADRKLDAAAVKGLIDTALFPADDAKAQKLVDDVASFEAFRDEVKQPWTKIELEPDHKDQLHGWLALARFLGAMPPDRPLGPHVALVYALGNIVDGGGDGVLGARQEIAAHTLVAALRAIAGDDSVKAVVLRVDSGGGSAQASELIWREVKALDAKKPVIVSMSDVAASGGYYISSGARKIYALPDTLTGSIGVVGGKLALGGAADKLGIKTYPMGRGKRATMMASLSPWTTDEKAVIQGTMESVYKQFVSRVAAGRHMTPDQVQPIAQGRVWTGAKAKELGLVDALGGLDAAVADAAQLVKLDPAGELEVYPPSPTLRDLLVGIGQVQAPFGLGAELHALDPDLASAAEHLVELVLSFRTARIQAVAFLPVLR
ncbi:MAG: signal peptide peptidase SppA [Acidobacteriota bacterium]